MFHMLYEPTLARLDLYYLQHEVNYELYKRTYNTPKVVEHK